MPELQSDRPEFQLQRFAAQLVASSDDAIVGKALDGTVRSWNPAAERVFGYSAAEMVGQSIFKLVPPELYPEEQEILARIGRGEHIHHYQTVRIAKDGRRLAISLTISPIYDSEGRLVGASSIKRDITADRREDEQRRQAQKMEALGQLAGGIAHDFNNILTIIGSLTSFRLEAADPGGERHTDLMSIRSAVDRAAQLTRQLLAFSRQQPVQPEILDLAEVVADTVKLLRRVLGEQIEIDAMGERGSTFVYADRGQLTQVLLNLALNARDAMPRGGTLTIETRVDGNTARLAVADTGTGMDAHTLCRVFEPFFTTKPRGEGTGLGLSTVFGIVQQAGGTIDVESAPGKGSVFRIGFPLAGVPTDAPGPVTPAAVTRASGSILLVEDSPDVAELAARSLREAGYRVTTAHGPTDAMTAFAEAHEPFQLLVTDVVMPTLDGRTLAQQLRADHPKLAVLFMSGYPGDALTTDAFGTDPLLTKPFTPDQLVSAVRRALDPSRPDRQGGAA